MMIRENHKSLLGLGILGLFVIFFIISSNIIKTIDPITNTEYSSVEMINLKTDPNRYEEKKISSGEKILEIDRDSMIDTIIITIKYDIKLRIQLNLGDIESMLEGMIIGGYIVFRGISKLASTGYVEVDEIYVHTTEGRYLVYGLSGPAFFIFVWIFFRVYRFYWKNLRFVSKENEEEIKNA